MSLVRIHPIRTPLEYDAVLSAAKRDNHAALCPTHWIDKDGLIAGAFGVNSIPFISTWYSTKLLRARDTLQAINIGEALVEHSGHQLVAVPCPSSSPLFPLMTKLGYEDVGKVHIFVKQLQKKG